MKKRFGIVFLIFLLISSNFCWYILYTRERNKVKDRIIPTLSSDYFTRQLVLTNNQMQLEEGKLENINFIEMMPEDANYKMKIALEQGLSISKEEHMMNLEIKDVPYLFQKPDYPNGCEAASAVMLLNYLGIDITLKEFVSKHLKMGEVYEKAGERFGPNPAQVYAGNPESENRGWGAFEPVISEAIRNILYKELPSSKNYIMTTGEDAKEPLYSLVLNHNPSIIWITVDYKEVTEVFKWFSYDKSKTYSYPLNQHVVVLTGADENYYYINDPLVGKNIKVERKTLEKSYDSMGRQYISVEIFEEEKEFR